MRQLPPLNTLRAFEAAARQNSFRNAAKELHVTPTAISHQIRYLEDLLLCPLFIRQPRPIRLTSEGEKLYPCIRDAMDLMEAGVAELQDQSVKGPLVVTSTRAFASRWLLPRLEGFRDACGGTAIAVNACEAVMDLHAGHADLAIRYQRSPDQDLQSHALFTDEYLPVCRPSLLPRNNSRAVLEDIGSYPLIHFDWQQDDPHAPTWDRWFAHASNRFPELRPPNLKAGLHFSEEIHAIEAALLGQGVALLSTVVVSKELAEGTLVPFVSEAIMGQTFYAAYRRDGGRLKEVRRLVDIIQSSVVGMQLDNSS